MTWNWWLVIGCVGQAAFFMRFLVQWIVSERRKTSTVPEAFWYFSLAGGVILLLYALHRRDPVFAVGQGCGVFIYVRNLVLIYRQNHDAGEKRSCEHIASRDAAQQT